MINPKEALPEGIPNIGAKFYALIATKSPFMRDVLSEIARDICSNIHSGKILDIGTGPGYLPIEIAKISAEVKIIGIDISSGMTEIATRNASSSGLSGRVQFQTANAANLPFKDGYFDFAISTLSLHHWRHPVEYLKEIGRVLKTGGEIHIYDFYREVKEETKAKIRKKYGWFWSVIFLKMARAHSIKSEELENIVSSLGRDFSQRYVEDQGVLFKLHLKK